MRDQNKDQLISDNSDHSDHSDNPDNSVNKAKLKRDAKEGQFYWLLLHPYVYGTVKGNKALLYNTLSGSFLEYVDNPPVIKLIKRLLADSNLYVLKIHGEKIDGPIADFVHDIRAGYMGDLIDVAHRRSKPFLMRPLLSLQKNYDIFTSAGKKDQTLAKDEIKNYLNVLTLYINSACPQSCKMCKTAAGQFQWCRKNGRTDDELPIALLKKLVDDVRHTRLFKINILGGNILGYNDLEELATLLNHLEVVKDYHLHYSNLPRYAEREDFFNRIESVGANSRNRLTILVDFPLDKNKLEEALVWLKECRCNVRFHFAIESYRHYQLAQETASTFLLMITISAPFTMVRTWTFSRSTSFWIRKPSWKARYRSMRSLPPELLIQDILRKWWFGPMAMSMPI